jgi:hypothetical protein
MLMSVATRYGKSSLQYMQAGGQLRQRSTRSTSTSTPAIASVTATSVISNGNGVKTVMKSKFPLSPHLPNKMTNFGSIPVLHQSVNS